MLKHARPSPPLPLAIPEFQSPNQARFLQNLLRKSKEKQTKKQNKKPLVSVFMFIQLFEQIQRLKELGRREEVTPNSRTRSWMAYWVFTVVAGRCGRSTSTISRINYWHREYSLVDGFPWLYSLILGIYAAGDPAGHLIGKPHVLQLSFVEFQPHTPIWIMYSFRSQGWALNKA